MANFKLVFLLEFLIIYLILISSAVAADPSLEELEALYFSELEQLKSKISFLESNIEERNHEMRKKEQSIVETEKIIQEKLDKVEKLEGEIALRQTRGSTHGNKHTRKEHTRTDELEKQIDRLRKEIEVQNQKKDTLEALSDEAERKIRELNLKLESLREVGDEQKIRVLKTEQSLQVAEEEIVNAALEEFSASKDAAQVYGGSLTRWLAVHLSHLLSFCIEAGKPVANKAYQMLLEWKAQAEKWLEAHSQIIRTFFWNEKCKTMANQAYQMLLEKKAVAEKWLGIQFQIIRTEWVPALTEQWLIFSTYLEPHVQCLATQTVDMYYKFKNSVVPWVVQEIKTLIELCINTAYRCFKTNTYLEKIQIAVEPHRKYIANAYQTFIDYATVYHHQVQNFLKTNEFTRPLAVKDLAWFMATFVLALPVIFLISLCSRIRSKRRLRKHTQTRRRVKRSYSS